MMDDNTAIEMMRRCSAEIKEMRATIAYLTPLAEAWQALRKVLDMLPGPSQAYGEDLVWKLDKHVAELEAKLKTEQVPE